MTDLLVLIPAYNESRGIAAVVEAARQTLPVVVVNDGSLDETARIAAASGALVIHQLPNQGKGAALRRGFRYAIAEGYEAAITLDADGQHDPAEIPVFVQAYEQRSADLIIGARQFTHMPAIRRLANTLGQWSFSWAVGQPIRDNQSGYRLVSRRLMEALLESTESGFEFEVEMIVVCLQQGFLLDWVPIHTIYAGEQSHIRPAHHLFHFIRILNKTRSEMRNYRRKK